MARKTPSKNRHTDHHHRLSRFNVSWHTFVALLAVSFLYEALPKELYWGPRGLMLGIVSCLIFLLMVTLWFGRLHTNRLINLLVNALIMFYLVLSVFRIVVAVFEGHIEASHLVVSAIALWATNILVFALWYWNLDAGGPNKRELQEGSWFGAFFFPQMQISLAENKQLPKAISDWKPHFIDYLFLAFNTGTAFSPTDTPVLSHWGKLMTMIQSMISLTILVMLAARAINIITPAMSF